MSQTTQSPVEGKLSIGESMEDMHPCPECGKATPNERQEILNIATCIDCTEQPFKYKGVMEYDEKAGGVLILCKSEKEFKELKASAIERRGEELPEE